jgi:hypothetical protein
VKTPPGGDSDGTCVKGTASDRHLQAKGSLRGSRPTLSFIVQNQLAPEGALRKT